MDASLRDDTVGFQCNMDEWTIGWTCGWTKDAGFLLDLTLGPFHLWARSRKL